MFRADCARYAGDPDFERLIARLAQKSAEFRQWWPRQEVLRPLAGHKRIKHPRAGCMTFEYTSFAVTDQIDMKLIVYTPLEADRTVEKLDRLLHPLPVDQRAGQPAMRLERVIGDLTGAGKT